MSSPDVLASLPTIGWPHVLLRLAVAAALGAAIGIERELRDREAGLRTHLVVAVGAALFTLVGSYGFDDVLGGGPHIQLDPSRVTAGIVSGIGFLGAGAIIRQGLSVRGLTTAASLWLVAAIGAASGAGLYDAAAIATGGALVTLGPLRIAAFRILSRFHPGHDRLLVDLRSGGSPAGIIDAIEGHGGRVVSLDVRQEGDRRSVAVDVELRHASAPAVVVGVADVEDVLEVRWMD